ncbi:MAG: rhomboid family intramembrane serine protease [Bryobacteraceae bacterium]|nr:rhomboid family intramembrane serine protease [Bryobacteraceae bacterium]
MIPLKSIRPVYSTPVVTAALIAINIAVFVYQFVLPVRAANAFVLQYGVIPDQLRYSTLITSMFLHGGIGHILGNMWFLWVFGRNVEDAMGSARYLLYYLVCGLAASLGQVLANPYSTVPMIGASGAISGVMGGYLIRFPRTPIVTLVFFIFVSFVELPAAVLLVYWLVVQLAGGIGSVADEATRGGVAWFAHIGGFAAGALITKLLPRARERYPIQEW